jgi:antitoxin CptB
MEPEGDDMVRRKRLLYRAWHRGMKEMDLVLGGFADKRLAELDEAEIKAFESIIAYPDVTLYRWLTGAESVPARYDNALLREVLNSAARL